jgi:hypothetical protein
MLATDGRQFGTLSHNKCNAHDLSAYGCLMPILANGALAFFTAAIRGAGGLCWQMGA